MNTTQDIYTMDTQELVDHILTQLKKQNWKPSRKDGSCFYRKDNLRCAVGHVIKDEHYNKAFDASNENTIRDVIENENCNSELKTFLEKHLDLLLNLQYWHDFRLSSNEDMNDTTWEFLTQYLESDINQHGLVIKHFSEY